LALAWFIPAVSRREAAAGFFVIARWAAAVMAAAPGGALLAELGSGDASCPARERRSGLEVKYLQERAKEGRRCGPLGSSSVWQVIGGYFTSATHSSRREKKASFSCAGRLANGMCKDLLATRSLMLVR
jgi:hypothetical protein